MTILTAKTDEAYRAAARLPCSLPMGGLQVDVDDAYIGCIDPLDYVETSPVNDNRENDRARINHWRL
jgi:hypothetical protein